MTEKLFSYGTLRDERVQRTVFGHTVESAPDAIVGYRLQPITLTDARTIAISGSAEHTILEASGADIDRVDGAVLHVTADDLARADAYEPPQYKRARAKLRSGGEAWVYVRA